MAARTKGVLALIALTLLVLAIVPPAFHPRWVIPLVATLGALLLSSMPDWLSVWPVTAFALSYASTYYVASDIGQGGVASYGGPWIFFPVLLGATAAVLMLSRGLRGTQRFWPPLMVSLGLLTAFFSGPQGGAGKLMRFLLEVLRLSEDAAMAVNFFFRKGVHLGVYGTLALAAGAVAYSHGGKTLGLWIAGLAWGTAHAVLDESRQAGTTLRTGSGWDVLLDLAGMSIALWLLQTRLSKEGKA